MQGEIIKKYTSLQVKSNEYKCSFWITPLTPPFGFAVSPFLLEIR
tara:strand:- start:95 stop:229 length:135 start_codon:yes stop_codon:yes gene_type:complete